MFNRRKFIFASAFLGSSLKYKIGTMIELPRACLTADTIAESADFFSFGTNDLTQTTFGFSREIMKIMKNHRRGRKKKFSTEHIF